MIKKCYLCGRIIKGNAHKADTRDDQWVFVGPDCAKKIKDAGEDGVPTKAGPGGVRLYSMKE
jgi:ribosome-binding protein aMBF1 (putative translation factor)